MSILIKGMEMPKHGCDHCFLRTGNYCGIIEKNESVVEYARKSERHPDCPLVNVPPHGRLIDADAEIEVWDVCNRQGVFPHFTTTVSRFLLGHIVGKIPPTIITEEEDEPSIDEAMAEFEQYCEMYEPTYDPETGAM